MTGCVAGATGSVATVVDGMDDGALSSPPACEPIPNPIAASASMFIAKRVFITDNPENWL